MWDAIDIEVSDPAPLSEEMRVKISAWIAYERAHAPSDCTWGTCRLCQRETQIRQARRIMA